MPTRTIPATVREYELKMRVDTTFRMPELTGHVAGLRGVEEQPALNLEADYYDTEDLRLLRWGATLRRRTGGADSGWHLKLPVSEGARDEIRLPLSAGESSQVPDALADIVTALRREAPLFQVATLRTHRVPRLLLDEDGQAYAELVDDAVSVSGGASFRELEVEALLPDVTDQVQAVAALLVDHGAVPGGAPKVSAAFGSRASEPPDVVVLPSPRPKDPAVEAVRAHLAKHVHRFLVEDIRMRRNLPDAVHQMRVAARQLRSGLKVFAPLVGHEWARQLRAELGWAADQLGDSRDTEVLLRRLTEHAGSLPPRQEELTVRAVEKALQTRLSDARAQALAALSSPRHVALLEALVAAVGDPHLTKVARRPCREVLPPLVADSWRVLAKDVKQLRQDSPAPAWHRTRIDAKKARYAAEAVAPIFGRRVKVLAHALGGVTDVLGDQHDATVAQEVLATMADTSDVDGATGYALGLLSAHEQQDVMDLRGDFRAVWPAAKKAHRQALPG